jgi:DNA-binding phage protein
MESIGKEIKRLMRAKGISGYRVAGALGVAPESLYRSVADSGNPEWRTIKAILDYLGYDLKIIKKKEVKPNRSRPKKRR